jgi:DNA mismatch repair protein MSH6
VDAILTRMGAYDSMFSHSSTFKVELDETSKILSTATPHSLVILDELGRGTSTFDGIAIAGAVLHHLATHTLALTCFATHYSSLTEDYGKRAEVRCMHMATGFDDEKREVRCFFIDSVAITEIFGFQLIWLYKLIQGTAPSSFGTHVASLAGVPQDVVARADQVSQDFSRQFTQRLTGKTAGKLPIAALVDLAFMAKLAAHDKGSMDNKEDVEGKRRKTLRILKEVAKGYANTSA